MTFVRAAPALARLLEPSGRITWSRVDSPKLRLSPPRTPWPCGWVGARAGQADSQVFTRFVGGYCPDYQAVAGITTLHLSPFGRGAFMEAFHPDERVKLIRCPHPVVRCPVCGLRHRFLELARERLCARCHVDLTRQVRAHFQECPAPLGERREVVATTQLGSKNRIRETAEQTRIERETPSGAQSGAEGEDQIRPRGCPVCALPVLAGDAVSFQRGKLWHLSCYESARRELPSRVPQSRRDRIDEIIGSQATCSSCLARRTGMTPGAVRTVALKLGRTASIVRELGRCATCRKTQLVLRRRRAG